MKKVESRKWKVESLDFRFWTLFGIWTLAFGLLIFPPLHASAAFQFVTCGQSNPTTGVVDHPCQFSDLVILLVRMTNYLITVAAVVAMYHVLGGGFDLVSALGNPEKIKRSQEKITQAVVGFGIVVLAFVFVNLLVNGLFGSPNPNSVRKWWDVDCLYNPKANGCPFNPDNPINR